MIDLATKGRFICALGIGYAQEDFDAFGVSMKERAPRTEERTEILRMRQATGPEQAEALADIRLFGEFGEEVIPHI